MSEEELKAIEERIERTMQKKTAWTWKAIARLMGEVVADNEDLVAEVRRLQTELANLKT